MTGGEPRYREVEAKTISRRAGYVDPWFIGSFGMNLYRGCEHGCLYCDGRAERYYVPGDFARDITVKRNALTVLERELSRAKEPGFVFIGGGVCDAYQPAEERYRLARGALELARDRRLPVHVLTKACLVERDLDLLEAINLDTRAILSLSIQTVDDEIRERFEPGAAPLDERFRLLGEAHRRGLGTGVMALPVLPGISDQPEAVATLVARAAEHGADFLCFGGLTLRPGKQKSTYLDAIREHYPALLDGYHKVYRREHSSGAPDHRYAARVDDRFRAALKRHGLPSRPPRRLFRGLLPLYAELAVLLEHRQQELRLAGYPAPPLGRAGYKIQHWAKAQLGKRGRRKGFRHTVIEDELRQMLSDGSVQRLGVSSSALAELRRLLAG